LFPGYPFPTSCVLLQVEKIQKGLTALSQHEIHIIQIFDSIPSTNDYLMQQIPVTATQTICCLSEQQTAGKGRRGQSWVSPFGHNIYLSLLWHFPLELSALSNLSLVVAIAVTRVLQHYAVTEPVGIKWPNDVLWNHQKLCGILIEIKQVAYHQTSMVIGIGLNTHMPQHTTLPISQAWTDLQQITGQLHDRNEVVSILLNELIATLVLFQAQAPGTGFLPFSETWRSLDLAFNKPITLITPTGTLQGMGRGVNSQGQYQVTLESGETQTFSSGHISLRLV